MSESTQILLAFGFMLAMYLVSRSIAARKLQKVSEFIIKELESQQAFDPVTAVELPYSKPSLIRLGMRDYNYKALEYMLSEEVIVKTAQGRYFLKGYRKRI